jgi:hypothetical protein
MNNHNPNTKRCEQGNVLNQGVQTASLDKFARKTNHKGSMTKIVDVRSNRTQPVNEL